MDLSANNSSIHPIFTADQRPKLGHDAYIEKSGFLFKKVSFLQTFLLKRNVRYLVLRGSNLKCFRKEDDPVPESVIVLENAHVSCWPEKSEIEIRAREVVEEFVAENGQQYQKWYSALKAASKKRIKDYYAFVKTLGEGQFGKILLAKDRRTREKFAVKVIHKQRSEKRNKKLIQRELAILRLVIHQNIVRLYDLFDTEDKLYFVLKYMQGGALYQVLSEDSAYFSEERASPIIRDILHGLVYLHTKGIVHRDVKPENIRTPENQRPFTSKSADFGLRNFLSTQDTLVSKVGNPYFCEREVVTNESYGAKADLWSLGVVAYEMLSGRKHFEKHQTRSVLDAILVGRWNFPAPDWDRISEDAKHIISSLICINLDRRMSAEQAVQHPWMLKRGCEQPIPQPAGNNTSMSGAVY